MPCFASLRAWRVPSGISFRRPKDDDAEQLTLPCGGCLGCRMRKARDWAVRCHLELGQHSRACWTTNTYDDKHVPPTLEKTHLSAWFKRLRDRRDVPPFRFFACGEYGGKTERPHYHAILFGLSDDAPLQDTWPFGFLTTHELTPASIAYVAGYTAKKQVLPHFDTGERVDPETGECYTYQPPFLHMSRRPGIAAHAREHWQSWRTSAIQSGREVPVPRYLHNAYKSSANPFQLEDLKYHQYLQSLKRDQNPDRLIAAEVIAESKLAYQTSKRAKL